MSIIAQNDPELQGPPADGPHWNQKIGEYEIWAYGECVGYAQEYQKAWMAYSSALHYQAEHIERNSANIQQVAQ